MNTGLTSDSPAERFTPGTLPVEVADFSSEIEARPHAGWSSKNIHNEMAVRLETLGPVVMREAALKSSLAYPGNPLTHVRYQSRGNRKLIVPERAFHTFGLWEGRVESIAADSFFAHLVEISGTDRYEDNAEFPLMDIEAEDLELFKIGARFLFMVGYSIDKYGTHTRGSRIRFERIPAWSDDEIIDAYEETKALDSFFEPKDSHPERPAAP